MMISNYMRDEHRSCDTMFAGAEEAVALGEWDVAEKRFLEFSSETLTHFKKEEDELFVVFEAQTGSSEGPTQVMCFEHDQVRGLIGKMAEAIDLKFVLQTLGDKCCKLVRQNFLLNKMVAVLHLFSKFLNLKSYLLQDG